MDKEIRVYEYELSCHPITDYQLLILKNDKRKALLIVPLGKVSADISSESLFEAEDMSIPILDMFMDVIKKLCGVFQKVVIDDLKKGMFFATMYFTDIDDDEFTVKAEAIDAMGIAVRTSCRLYVLESVIDAANNDSLNCVCWYNAEDKESLNKARALSNEKLAALPPHDLKQLLEIAVDIEDFEFAERLKKAQDFQIKLKELMQEALGEPEIQEGRQTRSKKKEKGIRYTISEDMKRNIDVKSTVNPIRKKDDEDSED